MKTTEIPRQYKIPEHAAADLITKPAAHSPAPWHYNPSPDNKPHTFPDELFDANGRRIIMLRASSAGIPDSQRAANGFLTEKAPEMLEALREWTAEAQNDGATSPAYWKARRLLDIMNKEIA